MNVYEVHAASLAALQTEYDQGDTVKCPVFLWREQNWKSLPGGARRRKDLGVGGFSLDSDLSIVCLVAQFGVSAQAQRDLMLNTQLTYLGQLYQIQTITIAAGGLQLQIECNDAQEGA